MRPIRRTVLLFLVLAALAPAAAADNPFYLTLRLGSTSLDADVEEAVDQVLDGDDNSLAVGLGFRFGKYMAFQAEWHDLGEVTGAGLPCPVDELILCAEPEIPIEADSSAVSVTFLPQLPLGGERFFLYGKLGFVSWESDVSEAIEAGSRLGEVSDEDLVYGLGFRVELPGPFTAFAEFEKFADTFETVALGATFGL